MALSIVNDIKEAKILLDRGVITENEYEKMRRIFISKTSKKEGCKYKGHLKKWFKC